jgi:hypothetical protein
MNEIFNLFIYSRGGGNAGSVFYVLGVLNQYLILDKKT